MSNDTLREFVLDLHRLANETAALIRDVRAETAAAEFRARACPRTKPLRAAGGPQADR